ncbi:MAG: hypothetical protein ACRC7N_17275 [Clostridium sp.]
MNININSIYCCLYKKCRDAYSKDLSSKMNVENEVQEKLLSKENINNQNNNNLLYTRTKHL